MYVVFDGQLLTVGYSKRSKGCHWESGLTATVCCTGIRPRSPREDEDPQVLCRYQNGGNGKAGVASDVWPTNVGILESMTVAILTCLRWMSLLEAQTPSLVNLAASKLLNIGGSFVSTLFNTQDLHHVLAVLSSRIRLDTIIHSHAATQVTDKAVSSHMRILSVSHDQVFRQSYSPSEPILSLGAAEVLMSAPKHYPRSIKKLAEQLGASYIDRGRFEEMMGRLVTVCARDLQTKSLDHNAPWWRPIRLLDFLDTLLGHDWGLNEMQVAEKVKFKNKFADSYINFTHWTKMNDPIDWKTDL